MEELVSMAMEASLEVKVVLMVYIGMLAVVSILYAVFDDEKVRNRARTGAAIVFVLTPSCLFPWYARMSGTAFSVRCGLEIRALSLNARQDLPVYLLAAAYACFAVIPLYGLSVITDQQIMWLSDMTVMILVSDALQFVGGRVINVSDYRPFPALSPKKSVGGYAMPLTVGVVLFHNTGFADWSMTAIFFVICFGIAGDLAASYLKRRAGVKDYGNYLGAHGGFMDRFDGVQFAYTVFMALTWMADLGLLESSPAR